MNGLSVICHDSAIHISAWATTFWRQVLNRGITANQKDSKKFGQVWRELKYFEQLVSNFL